MTFSFVFYADLIAHRSLAHTYSKQTGAQSAASTFRALSRKGAGRELCALFDQHNLSRCALTFSALRDFHDLLPVSFLPRKLVLPVRPTKSACRNLRAENYRFIDLYFC